MRSSGKGGGLGRPPKLRDIAERLDVSIGTVDRALHGRGRISDATRARVLAAAAALGYRPNMAARSLSARGRLTIAVCLPRAIESFYGDVRAGIEAAAEPLAPGGLDLAWFDYPRLGIGEAAALRAALATHPAGIVIAPGDPESLAAELEDARVRGVPVVCVSTDAPSSPRLASISVDPRTSGAIVGELLGRFLGGRGAIAVVGGSVGTSDHAEKIEGLAQACRAWWPGVTIPIVIEAHDDEAEARAKMREVLAVPKRVDAVYVATANSLPVLLEIERVKRLERQATTPLRRSAGGGLRGPRSRDPIVVTTDLFPALVPYIERGVVAATIYQRPRTQGRLAIEALRRYLVDRVEPPHSLRLSPHVVMRANLRLFTTKGA